MFLTECGNCKHEVEDLKGESTLVIIESTMGRREKKVETQVTIVDVTVSEDMKQGKRRKKKYNHNNYH